ncbi:MAG: hypothetical protein K6U04_09220 [Armatimonadetes bacterium]|nr:hypothetical protein [Armatimonadota bacterium]
MKGAGAGTKGEARAPGAVRSDGMGRGLTDGEIGLSGRAGKLKGDDCRREAA